MKTFQETVKTNKAIEKRSKRYIGRERRGGKKVQLENNIKMPLLLITTHQPRAHTAIAKKTTTTKKKHDDNSNSNRFTTHFHTHFDGLQMPYGVWQISGRIIRFYEAFLCDSPIEPIRALARSLALTQLNWLTRFYAVHYL